MEQESLYQQITDICFKHGSVNKPMVDNLFTLMEQEIARAQGKKLPNYFFDCLQCGKANSRRLAPSQIKGGYYMPKHCNRDCRREYTRTLKQLMEDK